MPLLHDAPVTADPHTSFPKDRIKVLLLENIHPSAHELFRAEGFHLETLPAGAQRGRARRAASPTCTCSASAARRASPTQVARRTRGACYASAASASAPTRSTSPSANQRGVPVFNAPFSNTRSVAEMIIAEVVMLARQLGDRVARGARRGSGARSRRAATRSAARRSASSATGTSAGSSASSPRSLGHARRLLRRRGQAPDGQQPRDQDARRAPRRRATSSRSTCPRRRRPAG